MAVVEVSSYQGVHARVLLHFPTYFTFSFLSLIVLTFRQATHQPANQPGREVNVRSGAIIYALLLLSSFPAGRRFPMRLLDNIGLQPCRRSLVSTEGGGGKRESTRSLILAIPPLQRSPPSFLPSVTFYHPPSFPSSPFPWPCRTGITPRVQRPCCLPANRSVSSGVVSMNTLSTNRTNYKIFPLFIFPTFPRTSRDNFLATLSLIISRVSFLVPLLLTT